MPCCADLAGEEGIPARADVQSLDVDEEEPCWLSAGGLLLGLNELDGVDAAGRRARTSSRWSRNILTPLKKI